MVLRRIEMAPWLLPNVFKAVWKCFVAASFVAIFLAASSLQAAPITVPTDLNLGDSYRLAFVTSSTTTANTSTDIGDYNTFVSGVANGQAELAALGTTWKVIGSTPTVAATNNTGTNPSSTGVPIYRLDGTRIADDNSDLWDGSILAPLIFTQVGIPTTFTKAHTGSWSDGNIVGGDGSLGKTFPAYGNPTKTNSEWISEGQVGPSLLPLYAMSGELTVVPEPSTVAFGLMGLLSLSYHGRRRR